MGTEGSTLLGRLLLNYGLVNEAQLQAALQVQEVTQEPLGQVLVSRGTLGLQELELALRAQARLRGKAEAGSPHVLIVDDDPEVGAVLGDILAGAGYSTGVAQNAAEATAALMAPDGTAPSLVLLDLGLPGTDGVSLLSHIRQHMMRRVPVVVLTAHPEMESEIRARALEISAFVVKPASARALVEIVDAAIREGVNTGARI